MSGGGFDLLMQRIDHISRDIDEMKGAIREMASAVTRLALVEERQAATSTALERLGNTIDKIDERLRALERSEPIQSRVSDWVMNAVWAAAAAAVMFIAGKAGLF